MKQIEKIFLILGYLIQLLIDLIAGLTITFGVIIVFPFTFIYKRLKQAVIDFDEQFLR